MDCPWRATADLVRGRVLKKVYRLQDEIASQSLYVRGWNCPGPIEYAVQKKLNDYDDLRTVINRKPIRILNMGKIGRPTHFGIFFAAN